MMRAALCATSAVLVALALAACGGSSAPLIPQPSAAVGVGAGVLSRAADASSAAKGYRSVIAMTETLPQGTITATGTGSFDRTPDSAQVNLTMNVPQLSAPLHVVETIERGVLYIKIPASLLAKLPASASVVLGGRQWIELSLSQLGKAEGIPGLGGLASDGSETTDPGRYLAMLKHVADVTKIGQQTLLGVQTTAYRANLSLADEFSILPGNHGSDRSLLALLRKEHETLSASPVEVWIDGAGLVRRVSEAVKMTVRGQPLTIDEQMDILSYGLQPSPTVPPAYETFNVSKLLTAAIARLH
jgi:hypothetical protein